MFTTKTLQLLLNKLPKPAREAHCAPSIVNNLVSVSVLCDAGCEVYFHHTGCEITFNGETIIRGWRYLRTNMWRISLLSNGGNNIIPNDDDSITEYVKILDFLVNSIYDCDTHEPADSILSCNNGPSCYFHMVQSHRRWILPRVARTHIKKSPPIHQSLRTN